jgi:acetyltransferase EpsM
MTADRMPVCLVGFDREVRDLILASGRSYAGYADRMAGGPGYLGKDEDVLSQGYDFAFGMLAPKLRAALHPRYNGRLPILIAPSCVIAADALLGEGSTAQHRCTLMSEARVGACVQMHVGVTIHHETVVGDYCSIASHAVLLGRVTVGQRSFVGAGAVIRDGCRIGSGVTVGAGAVVVHDIPDGSVVVGVPARPVKKV